MGPPHSESPFARPRSPPERGRAPGGALVRSSAAKRPARAGGALVSHGASPAVPSARAVLTSGFGMGPGVPPRPQPPARAGRSSPRAAPCAGRRRPSLPRGSPRSTLGARRLNFRVRDGAGCAPAARAAGPRKALLAKTSVPGCAGRPGGRTALGDFWEGPLSRGGEGVGPISGARLRASRPLHLRPINLVFCQGPRREGPSRGALRA